MNADIRDTLQPSPDVDRLDTVARGPGRRTRRTRRVVAGTVAAVVAATGGTRLLRDTAGGDSSAPPMATRPSHHPSAAAASAPGHVRDPHRLTARVATAADLSATRTAYAVLVADGWTASPGQSFVVDEKLYYAHGDHGVSLNWRPARDAGEPGMFGPVAGTATIDGDPADIRGDGVYTVVGPVRDGRMLTLSGDEGMTMDDLRALAAQVHRQ